MMDPNQIIKIRVSKSELWEHSDLDRNVKLISAENYGTNTLPSLYLGYLKLPSFYSGFM